MNSFLSSQLSNKSGLVRKAAAALLRAPKKLAAWRSGSVNYLRRPPVLANSFPKSGTHLVFQIVDGLPERVNFGEFLASMTTSFQFRRRSDASTLRIIRGIVPGEVVRGHLYYEERFRAALSEKNVVHYFVYRDLRDIVVSEAHYLRDINRWHRLHRYFAQAPSIADAIRLSITGLDPPIPEIEYPNIAERFARYAGWLHCDDCLAIKFEDLRSERQAEWIHRMAEFYAARVDAPCDVDACVRDMTAKIAPEKSHTFRSGEKAGWKKEFTAEHRRLFDDFAGQLLIDLGYEPNHDWATKAAATTWPQLPGR